MLKIKLFATQGHAHVVRKVILNHLFYWLLCIPLCKFIVENGRDKISHENVAGFVGKCRKYKQITTTLHNINMKMLFYHTAPSSVTYYT
jgi:hypothetical protein